MFTLLPSIYLMGIDFYRQWKASTHRDDEHSENILQTINRRNPPTSIPCREVNENRLTNGNHSHHESNPRVRSRKKKCTSVFKIERRKTFTDELLDDDVTFLMKKTEFTREQIVVWHGDFLSDCPEGKLSKTKFIEIYQQFYKKGRVTKFCEQAFRVFDRDHSGYMDFVEFLLAVNLTSSNDPEQKIELFFAMYDLDSNGRIDEHEMHCFLESIYDLMGIDISDPSRIDSKVYAIFSRAECDSSGCLRRDQFAVVCRNDRRIRKLLAANGKPNNES